MGREQRRKVRVDHVRGGWTEQDSAPLIHYITFQNAYALCVPERIRTIVCVLWQVNGRLVGARGAGDPEAGRLRRGELA